MNGAARQRAQGAMLVKLRKARLESSAAALAEARRATESADAAAQAADLAAEQAASAQDGARDALIADPGQAEPRLAVLDRARFEQALARSAADTAAEQLATCEQDEAARRRALILAQARHDVLAEHIGSLRRRAGYRLEERTAKDLEDDRSRT